MVMFLTSSFLNRTVMTPEMAFTTVDFPWATCPIVPVPQSRSTTGLQDRLAQPANAKHTQVNRGLFHHNKSAVAPKLPKICSERTCFEITSGESAVSFVTSTSMKGISSSSSTSESDSSERCCRVSSPGMMAFGRVWCSWMFELEIMSFLTFY